MSTFAHSRIICTKEILDEWFLTSDTDGGEGGESPYITFKKIMKRTEDECYFTDMCEVSFYMYRALADGRWEILINHRHGIYPIRAILKAVEMFKDKIEWYSERENIYISRFYWCDGQVKEDIMPIDGVYDDFDDNYEKMEGMIVQRSEREQYVTDEAWIYMELYPKPWINWPCDDFEERYFDKYDTEPYLAFISEKGLSVK